MNTLSAYLHGFDYDWERLVKRSGSRLYLVFFISILPIIAAAEPAVDAITTGNPTSIILAVVGVIGGIITLLGSIVMLMNEQMKRMGQAIPRGTTDVDAAVKSKIVDFDNRLSAHEEIVKGWRKDVNKHLGEQDLKLDVLTLGMSKLLKIAEAVKEA